MYYRQGLSSSIPCNTLYSTVLMGGAYQFSSSVCSSFPPLPITERTRGSLVGEHASHRSVDHDEECCLSMLSCLFNLSCSLIISCISLHSVRRYDGTLTPLDFLALCPTPSPLTSPSDHRPLSYPSPPTSTSSSSFSSIQLKKSPVVETVMEQCLLCLCEFVSEH